VTSVRLTLALVCAGLGLVSHRGSAQSASQLLEGGVRAYGNLDFDGASGLLRRALALSDSTALTGTARSRALTYLAAAEQFRGGQDSAVAVFGQLVIADPRYRPDQLVFPPEVLSVFEAARLRTKAVAVELPRTSQIQVGRETWLARVYASSFHEISAELTRNDGGLARTVYRGPIGDSLVLRWDGRDAAGEPVASGGYLFVVTSRDAQGQVLRLVQAPLEIERAQRDTLPSPPRLADSLFLPERARSGPGIEALAGGVLGAASVLVLPRVLAPGSELTGARFVVAGGVSLAGIAGFLARYPGRPIARNVEANRVVRQRWVEQSESVRLENIERRRDARLTIRAGPAVHIERDPR
jgi:hypothetical protein